MNLVQCSTPSCYIQERAVVGVEIICHVCVNKVDLQIQNQHQDQLNQIKPKPTNTPVYKRKRWTKTEAAIIYDFVQTHNIAELMKMLPGRTGYAVENRIFKLKVDHVAKQKYVDQIN